MKLDEPKVIRWSRADYYKITEAELFEGRRVELIEGEVTEMGPQDSLHASGVSIADDALRLVFGKGYSIRVQMPLSLGEDSDPEPDVAVVSGSPRDYISSHPSTSLLVIEVSSSSLTYDRTLKASLYASKGIDDYWLLNLIDHQLEIHRDPMPDVSEPYAFSYKDITILKAGDSTSPLAAPQVAISVADLLP